MSCLRIPRIELQHIDHICAKFRLLDVEVSFANAIRRTILADIPTVAITTDDETCNVEINTSRLSTEIIKHRLSCIPVHLPVEDAAKYILKVDVANATDQTMYVTTEDFTLWTRSTAAGADVSKKENEIAPQNEQLVDISVCRKIFPPSTVTLLNTPNPSFIDVCRLRPSLGPSIPGEQLKFTAEFSVRTAAENSVYNVVSKCTFENTIDESAAREAWSQEEKTLGTTVTDATQMQMHKKNFEILQFQRHFVRDSFDFTVESIGAFSANAILLTACDILISRLRAVSAHLETGTLIRVVGESIMQDERSFDIVMQEEGYTIGKMLEYLVYDLYFEGRSGSKTLIYCGFVKPHPHDDECILRVVFENAEVSIAAAPAPAPAPASAAGEVVASTNTKKVGISKTMVAEMLISAAEHGVRMMTIVRAAFQDKKSVFNKTQSTNSAVVRRADEKTIV